MNRVKRFLIGATVSTLLFAAAVSPVMAGSLLLQRETNPPPANPPEVLEKVCISTTEHGDGVTHTDAGGLSTSPSEDCT